MIDARIPLMLGDTGAPFKQLSQGLQQGRQRGIDNEKMQMLREQAMRQKQTHEGQMDDRRTLEFFRNVVPAAETTLGMISSNDIEGAKGFLDRRISDLEASGVDSADTKDVRALLESGDVQSAVGELNNAIAQGKAFGITTSAGAKTSGMSKIYSNGTSLQLFDKGERRVTLADGTVAEGKAAAEALADARESDIKEQLERSGARTQGSQNEGRDADLINRGVALAESTATIRRGLELLQRVETGGPEAIGLRAKQAFGAESADEGELSNVVGKAVLSQLRETFGPQFTESEGARLERIEASFGKSNATNIRLLTQALRMAERTAQRARSLAAEKGLDAVVADIDDLLTFSLSIPEDIDETDIFSQADAIIGN